MNRSMLGTVKINWNRVLPFVFVALFALSRWPGLLPWDFSAAYALAFCAGVYFPKRLSWWLPIVVLLATDVGLNFYYQHKYPQIDVWGADKIANLAFNYLGYGILLFIGRRLKPKSSFGSLIGGSLIGAVLFYLITNTATWLFNPTHESEYVVKTLATWILALTKGVSGWPAAWEFFRNTLLGTGLFTALFVAAEKLTAPVESPADKLAGARADEPEAADGEPAPEEAKA